MTDIAAIPATGPLAPKSRRIFLDRLDVPVDIGFHAFEIGTPQRLLVTVEVLVDETHFPSSDRVEEAWDYDPLREAILALAARGRFNLQETFARAVYAFCAARPGVEGIRVTTCKPDVYPSCAGVGVTIASF